MNYNFLFTCLVFITLLITVTTSRKRRRVFDNAETIFRDDYGEAFYDHDCPRDKTHNPNLVISNNTWHSTLSITCLAAYPITIEFDGTMPNSPGAKLALVSSNPSNQTKACYIVNLIGHVYWSTASPIGNYTCKSLTTPKKETSMYIFAKDHWGTYSSSPFNANQNVIVYVNTYNISKLRIPCPARKATLTNATLTKYDPITMEQIDVEKIDKWKKTYDLKKGFDVTFPEDKDENSTDVEGKYFCKQSTDFSGEVEVDVQHADFIISPNKTNLTIDQGQLTLECYSGQPISLKILSKSSDLQEIQEKDKDIPEMYKNAGYFHHAKAVYKTTDQKFQGEIACVNETGSQLFVWHIDNEYLCKCQWNASRFESPHYYDPYGGESVTPEYGESGSDKRPRWQSNDWTFYNGPYGSGEVTCYNEKASFVDWTFYACGNPVECQMMERCFKEDCPHISGHNYYPMIRPATNSSTRYSELQPGVIQCSADTFTSLFKISTDLDMNMYFNKEKSENTLKIRAGETYLYTGDKMIFSCTATKFSLLNQLVWSFEYKNGSFSYPELKTNDWRFGRSDDQTSSVSMIGIVRTSYLTIPSSDAVRLWCSAPRWNSTEWEKTSIDLHVNDATPAENPPICPSGSSSFIVMFRNTSSTFSQRIHLPHIVDGKDVTVHDPIESVSLYCLAKYPIRWVKDGVNISNTKTSRANCKKDKQSGVLKNKLYKITVTFPLAGINSTGNYTCRSTTPHLTRQTSVYIYAREFENRTFFVNEGHHYQINHKYDNYSSNFDKWAVIPCRLNHPDNPPYLFIDHAEQESVEPVPFDKSFMKFDPKVGFSIDVTNRRIIKNETTIFICSDHKDGSFIGNLVTLRLVYDRNTSLETTTTTTKSPSSGTATTNKPPQLNSTVSPSTAKPVTQTEREIGNAGFIVSIILLVSICCACVGVIFHLYQKITYQEKNNPPPQELDWANATDHTIGNNIGNFIDTNNHHVNNIIEPMPSLSEIYPVKD